MVCYRLEIELLVRSGGDLLSHVLRRSTIGATALNGRVRDGIGCFARAMTTRPEEKLPRIFFRGHQFCFPRFVLLLTVEVYACLPLDQIKPIEQLVPVS